MKSLMIGALAALAFAGSAAAAPVDYVQGQLGFRTQGFTVANPTVNAGSVAVGKNFGPIAVEGEYVRLNGIQDRGVAANLFNVNLVAKPFTFGRVTPFIEGGLGYANAHGSNIVGNNDGLALNAGAGATVRLGRGFDLVGSARYFSAATVDVRHASGALSGAAEETVTAGLRYNF